MAARRPYRKLTDRQRRGRYLARGLRLPAVALLLVAALVLGDRLGLFGTSPLQLAGDDYARYNGRSFPVARVVDGDTLDIRAADRGRSVTRVRLWGVDTPETKHPDKPVQHFGPEAEAFTRRLCGGKVVKLELLPGRTRGRYGRLLAYVFLPDGTMLNRRLVRLGYAYADPRYDHPLMAEFLRLEKAARRQRLGLWKDVKPSDLPYYKKKQPAVR
ncbi:MAG: thermonuclease family protein [Planctomycetes bacterium]|nr:thermonuclease family protein [Planctomycetota bacterium]